MTVDKLIAMNKLMLVPATKTEVTTFYSRIEKKSEFISLIQGNKGFTAFQERTKPKKLTIGGEPIINIVQWQMALLLSSGAVKLALAVTFTLYKAWIRFLKW